MNSLRRYIGLGIGSLASTSMLLASVAFGAGTAAAAGNAGAVYILTNTNTNNQVAIFNRSANGGLTAAGMVSTGGNGSGAGLGSEGALVLSRDHRWLFAVNAGSNEVSAFAVKAKGLDFAGKVGSGGANPVSLTVAKGVLYVLNAGNSAAAGNINGFKIGQHGELSWLAGSTQPLSSGGPGAAIGAAQVSFNPDADVLVVTEKSTSKIDVYSVGDNGVAHTPQTYASNGAVPYGFAFNNRGTLIVSEAGPGALSSYHVSDDSLHLVSGSVSTQQAAPCWVITTQDGKYAYTTNAHSGSISGFSIAMDGSLTALTPGGITGSTGGAPLDMGLSVDSHFLYALNAGTHSINAFEAHANGSLAPLAGIGGLPASATDIAVR
jgi:6-phosphogluconolactonase